MATRAVILDLDGTLLDTLEDITDSVNYALLQFGYPTRTLDEVRRFVGNGAVKLLERALPCELPKAQFDAFYRCYDAQYTAHGQDKTRPYDGASELLRELRARGLFTAVLSNKQDKAVRILCAHYFPDLLNMATGPTAERRTKPAPDGVLYIAETLGVCMDEILPGRDRHFQGNEYEVLCVATHSETLEPMVVYRALYGERGVWVRPAQMWNETVTRDGQTFSRFTRLET